MDLLQDFVNVRRVGLLERLRLELLITATSWRCSLLRCSCLLGRLVDCRLGRCLASCGSRLLADGLALDAGGAIVE